MILLASNSPRRRELLGGLNIPFRCVSIDADESFPNTLQAEEIPLYIAEKKSLAYSQPIDDSDVLITADTIVWLDGKMFGKPKDNQDAIDMLKNLSGKTHQVYTAVTFRTCRPEQFCSLVDKTDVTFRTLSADEINYYVTHFSPLDKAGAYGIQEWIGYVGVTGINGSYFNVVGFPIERVYTQLKTLLVDSKN